MSSNASPAFMAHLLSWPASMRPLESMENTCSTSSVTLHYIACGQTLPISKSFCQTRFCNVGNKEFHCFKNQVNMPVSILFLLVVCNHLLLILLHSESAATVPGFCPDSLDLVSFPSCELLFACYPLREFSRCASFICSVLRLPTKLIMQLFFSTCAWTVFV